MVLFHANDDSDAVIGGQLKQYNTQSRISPVLLEQCFSNLALQMYIRKETE